MANIITFDPINWTIPGYGSGTIPLTSKEVAISAVINASWNLGTEFSNKVSEHVGKVTDGYTDPDTGIFYPGYLNTVSTPTVTAGSVAAPSVTAPGVSIPTEVDSNAIMSTFDTKYMELVDLLSERFNDFRDQFFPNESESYLAAEAWLKEALESTTGGIPDAAFETLLESERSRVLDDASRASDAVLSTFAARRFPVPPGAAVGAIAMIQQKAQGEIAEGNRKLTALAVEMKKFSVEKLLGLRQSAMGAAVDYIKALASGPDMATRVVTAGYDAQSKLISAAADFYRADIASAELTSKVGQFNQSLALDAATKNQTAQLTIIEDKLKALLAETQSLAQMATSLFNNLNSSVSM